MKKKLLSFILAVVMIVSMIPASVLPAYAESSDFVIDENGVLTAYNGEGGDIVIPDNVTSIGEAVFVEKDVWSVVIPAGVESIGPYAFAYCNWLSKIIFNSEVENIGEYAFGSTYELESVYYPCGLDGDAIKNRMGPCGSYYEVSYRPIHNYVNGLCSVCGLDRTVDFNIDENGTVTKYLGYDTNVVIPAGVKAIGENAFSGDRHIKNVIISEGVTSIGDFAFSDSHVTSVIIPEGVTSIGDNAFYNCRDLVSVTIPSTVKNWGFASFECCTSLSDVDLADGLTCLGDGLFNHCTALTSLNIPDSVTEFGLSCLSIDNGICNNPDNWDTGIVYSGVMYCGNHLLYAWHLEGDYVIKDGTKVIANDAFSGSYGLTGVTIPDSVIHIGSNAFNGCGTLTSVTMTDNPKTIEDNAFAYCDGLTKVNYQCEDDVDVIKSMMSPFGEFRYVPKHHFVGSKCEGCGQMEFEIDINDVLVAYYGYGGDIVIPDGVVAVADEVFKGNSTITGVIFPDSLVTIGDEAFADCDSLTTISFPSDEISIGTRAFADCDSLTTLSFLSDEVSVGSRAFEFCQRLSSITMSDTTTFSGDTPFKYCDSLETVFYPCDSDVDMIKTALAPVQEDLWKSFDFVPLHHFVGQFCSECGYDCANDYIFDENGVVISYIGRGGDIVIPEQATAIGRYAFELNNNITSVVIPEGVTSIGVTAFKGCENLKSVTISSTVENIEDGAFEFCVNLIDINIPNSVKSIGDHVFEDCVNLVSITIPASVESMGDEVFSNCEKLSDVTLSDGLTALDSFLFRNCPNLVSISIPDSVTSIVTTAFGIDSGIFNNPAYWDTGIAGKGGFYIDGCLIDYRYNGKPDYTIKDGTRLISDWFMHYTNYNLNITIPDSVEIIGDYAFTSGSAQSITITDSPKTIEDGAFSRCDCTVYYHCNDDADAIKEMMSPHGSFTYVQLDHAFENGKCKICGYECTHSFSNCVCTVCGYVHHDFTDSYIDNGDGTHSGKCACGEIDTVKADHDCNASGECTKCGAKVTVLYKNYLVEGHEPVANGESGLYNRYSYYLDASGNEVVLNEKLYNEDKSVTFEQWYLRTMVQYKHEGDNLRLRFVTMLDENLEDYEEAGFIYTVDGAQDKLMTTEGNTSFVADGETTYITEYSQSDDFFVMQNTLFAKEVVNQNPAFTVTAYVKLMDGTVLTGKTVSFHLSDFVK